MVEPHFLQNAASASFDVPQEAQAGRASGAGASTSALSATTTPFSTRPRFSRYSRASRSASLAQGRHFEIHLPHHRLGLVAVARHEGAIVGVVNLAQRVLALQVFQRAQHAVLLLAEIVHAMTPGGERLEVDGQREHRR